MPALKVTRRTCTYAQEGWPLAAGGSRHRRRKGLLVLVEMRMALVLLICRGIEWIRMPRAALCPLTHVRFA